MPPAAPSVRPCGACLPAGLNTVRPIGLTEYSINNERVSNAGLVPGNNDDDTMPPSLLPGTKENVTGWIKCYDWD